MKKQIIYLICFIPFVFACNNFLDVTPKDKQTAPQMFATKGGYYAAVNGIYNSIASETLYGKSLSYEMIDILGRRYAVYYRQGFVDYYYQLSISGFTSTSVEVQLAAIWRTVYNTILNCNVVIDNLEKETQSLTDREKSLLMGEMLAVRAFLHFDMLRLFGPIFSSDPMAIAIPYNESSVITALPILSAETVLKDKILRDFRQAESLMKDHDPVITDGPTTTAGEGEVYLRYRQLRLNYYAVKALKARAYLYAQDKENALREAKDLLENQTFHQHFPAVDPNTLLANQRNPDRIFSSEVLWAIYKKDRSDIYTRTFNYETAGAFYFLQPRDYLTSNLFTNLQDYRFQSQWQTTTASVGHDLIKFKGIDRPDPADPTSEYFYATLMSLVRMGELYYIAAESEPELADGYEWLNRQRARRGLPTMAVGTSSAFLTELRNEYIREFAGEGQVFYLYKRLAVSMGPFENGSMLGTVAATSANYIPTLPSSEFEYR